MLVHQRVTLKSLKSHQEVKARGAEALELELPFDEAIKKNLSRILI